MGGPIHWKRIPTRRRLSPYTKSLQGSADREHPNHLKLRLPAFLAFTTWTQMFSQPAHTPQERLMALSCWRRFTLKPHQTKRNHKGAEFLGLGRILIKRLRWTLVASISCEDVSGDLNPHLNHSFFGGHPKHTTPKTYPLGGRLELLALPMLIGWCLVTGESA